MIRAVKWLRDKAFTATLYETGCRIGEFLFLRIRHIQFDSHGALVSVPYFGKTGSRRVRVVVSAPYLAEWIDKHPGNDKPDAYLWPGPTGKALKYDRIRAILRGAAAKAGVRKRVNPHSFRHARATHLASHLTEAQMKEFFGWVSLCIYPVKSRAEAQVLIPRRC